MIHENFTIDIDIDISEEEFSIYVRDKYQITIENLLNNNCSSITDYDITMDRKKCGYILRITFFKNKNTNNYLNKYILAKDMANHFNSSTITIILIKDNPYDADLCIFEPNGNIYKILDDENYFSEVLEPELRRKGYSDLEIMRFPIGVVPILETKEEISFDKLIELGELS